MKGGSDLPLRRPTSQLEEAELGLAPETTHDSATRISRINTIREQESRFSTNRDEKPNEMLRNIYGDIEKSETSLNWTKEVDKFEKRLTTTKGHQREANESQNESSSTKIMRNDSPSRGYSLEFRSGSKQYFTISGKHY